MQENLSTNLSHAKKDGSFDDIINHYRQKIISRGDLPNATVNRQLEILQQFSTFPLGRFILERRGANGFWTDYMVSHPTRGKISGLNVEGKPFNSIEDFFLNRCPIVVAHQERFQIFQKLAQNLIKEGAVLASIPCGMMRDLLTLDYSSVSDFKLVGIDIDPESLELARNLALENHVQNVQLHQQDAWEISFKEELDIIVSSGLNVYEPDPQKLLQLYEHFFRALKPGGSLIISVLTYPPGELVPTSWDLKGISKETLLIDRILHKDILDIKWRNFRSLEDLDKEFLAVGFCKVEVYMDKHRVFPTILATKSL